MLPKRIWLAGLSFLLTLPMALPAAPPTASEDAEADGAVTEAVETVETEAAESAEADPPTEADDAPKAEAGPGIKKREPTQFIRVRKDEDGEPVALQTAIVRYVSANEDSGVSLDLIAVVHIGDRGYYKKLNKEFEGYDAVLYELVAEKGTRVPKGGREGGDMLPIVMMKQWVDLDSQLEFIDYQKENLVHADMSPEEMGKAMKERGDNGFTVALGVLRDMIRESNRLAAQQQQAELPEISLTDLLFNQDGGRKLKRFLALQLGDPAASAALGETLNTLLVEDRNQAALKVFGKELAGGKKKMALFYGAAHMPDFEQRLLTEYGLKRDKIRWLTAWDLE